MKPARPLGIGVLGCADIAWRRMLPALAGEPCVRIAALSSRSLQRARRFARRFGGEPVEGYDALLRRRDVQAVYVPLPTGLRAAWIARALDAGKHVLAEKPLTTSSAGAVELVAAAETRGLVLVENFAFLHHSLATEVGRLLHSGAIGEPRAFTSEFGMPPRPAHDFRYRPELGGGALLDIGAYPLRAAQHFLGPGLETVGATLQYDDANGVDIAGTALLATPMGVAAHLSFGMDHQYRCRYALWGSEGRLEVDRAFTPPPGHQPVVALERGALREERTLPADDQFANVVRAFLGAVHGDAPLATAPILQQAALVDRIRTTAVRVSQAVCGG